MSESPTLPLDNRLAVEVRSMNERLSNLEAKVEQRLPDTRPIWERLLAEFSDMRAEFSDMRAAQQRFETQLAQFDARQVRFEAQLAQFDARLAGFEERLAGFDARLAGFEERQSGFDAALQRLEDGQRRLEAGQDDVRAELRQFRIDMRDALHKLDRQITALSKLFVEKQADVLGLEDRIEKLEGERGSTD